jgi:CTP synthase
MHLTLLPYLAASGELKTKPTQHSVKELQSIGLAPDVLVCRSEHPIPEREREKIALFCNVRKEAVIAAYDLRSIYEAPLAYHREGLDQAVLDAFGISPAPRPNLSSGPTSGTDSKNPEGEVRVAVVGKYTQLEDAYKSIAEALTAWRHGEPGEGNAEWGPGRDLRARGPRPYLGGVRRDPRAGRVLGAGDRGDDQCRALRPEHQVPYSGSAWGCRWPSSRPRATWRR